MIDWNKTEDTKPYLSSYVCTCNTDEDDIALLYYMADKDIWCSCYDIEVEPPKYWAEPEDVMVKDIRLPVDKEFETAKKFLTDIGFKDISIYDRDHVKKIYSIIHDRDHVKKYI